MCHCPLNNSEADLERTEDEVEKKGVVVGGRRRGERRHGGERHGTEGGQRSSSSCRGAGSSSRGTGSS